MRLVVEVIVVQSMAVPLVVLMMMVLPLVVQHQTWPVAVQKEVISRVRMSHCAVVDLVALERILFAFLMDPAKRNAAQKTEFVAAVMTRSA